MNFRWSFDEEGGRGGYVGSCSTRSVLGLMVCSLKINSKQNLEEKMEFLTSWNMLLICSWKVPPQQLVKWQYLLYLSKKTRKRHRRTISLLGASSSPTWRYSSVRCKIKRANDHIFLFAGFRYRTQNIIQSHPCLMPLLTGIVHPNPSWYHPCKQSWIYIEVKNLSKRTNLILGERACWCAT